MEDLVETLTRGNTAEVKVLLASVALALGVYQLAVIAVGYGKVRLPFLAPPPAFQAHRAVGDTIALLLLCTGIMCLSVYGFEDDHAVHAYAGTALLSVLALKVGSRTARLRARPVPARARRDGVRPARADVGDLGRGVPRVSRQLLGSLLAAVAIVVIVVVVVTAKFGSTSAAERESLEERQEQRLEAEEEQREDAEDRREDER